MSVAKEVRAARNRRYYEARRMPVAEKIKTPHPRIQGTPTMLSQVVDNESPADTELRRLRCINAALLRAQNKRLTQEDQQRRGIQPHCNSPDPVRVALTTTQKCHLGGPL